MNDDILKAFLELPQKLHTVRLLLSDIKYIYSLASNAMAIVFTQIKNNTKESDGHVPKLATPEFRQTDRGKL